MLKDEIYRQHIKDQYSAEVRDNNKSKESLKTLFKLCDQADEISKKINDLSKSIEELEQEIKFDELF